MSNYCDPLLTALKDCLLHSDCVLKQGYLPSQCLKEHFDDLPEQCKSLRQATFECKRGMVRHFSDAHGQAVCLITFGTCSTVSWT